MFKSDGHVVILAAQDGLKITGVGVREVDVSSCDRRGAGKLADL